MVGVKESGMMGEGRRFALFSESTSEVAMVIFSSRIFWIVGLEGRSLSFYL